MGLYKFKLVHSSDWQPINYTTLGQGYYFNTPTGWTPISADLTYCFTDMFNDYVRNELGLDNIYADKNNNEIIVNDKHFKVELHHLYDFQVFICDSYDYEYILFLSDSIYPDSNLYTGGDNITQWTGGAPHQSDWTCYSSRTISYRQFCLCYLIENENGIFEPNILGGAVDNTTKSNSVLWSNAPVSFFNSSMGKVNKFKNNTNIHISKLFCHKNSSLLEIVCPAHLYVAQNLVDSSFKSIVKNADRSFINVGNIFYMPYDDIILNETTWKGDAKPE